MINQYTRIYLNADKEIKHIHTNTSPFDFEPVEDQNASYAIDAVIETNEYIDAAKMFKDIKGLDEIGNPLFSRHKGLKNTSVRVVRGFHKRF